MISRLLICLNAAGCALLIALTIILWIGERSLSLGLAASQRELAEASAALAAKDKRLHALEADIGRLKESLASTQQAAETSARELSEKAIQVGELDTGLKAAREQATAWEAAIKGRDERIATLTESLLATRKRLDEAVERLKQVAKERKAAR